MIEEGLVDLEAQDERIIERFYDLYSVWCKNHGVKPTIKGLLIWHEENYQ